MMMLTSKGLTPLLLQGLQHLQMPSKSRQNFFGHNVAKILLDHLEAVQQIPPHCATAVGQKVTMQRTASILSPIASSVSELATWKQPVDKRNPKMRAGQVEKHVGIQ